MKTPENEFILTVTLHRPWALWVCAGWKIIETRLHERFKNLVGQRIAIHAAQKWDRTALQKAKLWMNEERLRLTAQWEASGVGSGEIVATAFVKEFGPLKPVHEKFAMIECSTRRFGLLLEDIRPTRSPKIRGRQGVFHVRCNSIVHVSQ